MPLVLPHIDHRFLQRLRLLGLTEGVSTLVLFGVAMPLKYLGGMPLAVTIGGSIHGFLFLALVTMFVRAIKRVPISRRLAGAGIVGAIVPFGPFIVDRWLGGVGAPYGWLKDSR
ncbi:MAG: DUF3817 domain-containing protein [Vicinamibacterales bacterium]